MGSAALVLAACGSNPSSSTSKGVGINLTPSPNFAYPVTDPNLPQDCAQNPSQIPAQSGGVIRVTAQAVPKANFAFMTAELSAFVHDAGNCIYSANIVKRGNRYDMVFGFVNDSGRMNPSAVAHFLRLQQFAIASVTLS